jgi:hypothetical protein
MASGTILQLSGWNGDVEATGTDSGQLEVRAAFEGRHPERMKVVLRPEAGGVAVCVFFADEPIETCHLGQIQRTVTHGESDSASVRLIARVPKGVLLVADSTNGKITATGMTADVRASTLNGDVVVSTSGMATAGTTNGAIDATMGTVPSRPLSFTSTNGRVHVALPAGVDADVFAATTNGSINANFPMSIQSQPYGAGPKSGRGRLGRGGVHIEARTTNGDVDLRAGG